MRSEGSIIPASSIPIIGEELTPAHPDGQTAHLGWAWPSLLSRVRRDRDYVAGSGVGRLHFLRHENIGQRDQWCGRAGPTGEPVPAAVARGRKYLLAQW